MKKAIKLKWFIAVSLLTLAAVTVAGFTLLSARYFILGMDSMVVGNIEKSVQRYHQDGSRDPYSDHIITTSWKKQPRGVLDAFDHPPERAGELYKIEMFDQESDDHSVYFSMKWHLEGEVYYVSHQMQLEVVSTMVHRNIEKSLDTLLITSGLSLLLFCFVLWVLMRRVSQPIAALNKWTRELNSKSLKNTIPDFTYRELNEQATLISRSLSTVQDSLERESLFLRHTSHELRTPISVIRSNIDLMHKLVENGQSSIDPRQQLVFDRIDRASLTMRSLTETLLWLSREECESLPESTVRLDLLTQQLVSELAYLLENKAIETDVRTESSSIQLPSAAAHIVLGNLIRNAFQHSSEGKVLIRQQGTFITITNKMSKEHYCVGDKDLGFGLGLQLIEQLTQRLNWAYTTEKNQNLNIVTVDFQS